MEIHIKTIPHSEERYSTVGDYWYDENKVLQIRVSQMNNSKYEKLVILHELIEQFLTEENDVSEQSITDFDIEYERKRELGEVDAYSEPGFSSDAPYRKEHTIATGIELIMASQFGVNWNEYDKTVNSL